MGFIFCRTTKRTMYKTLSLLLAASSVDARMSFGSCPPANNMYPVDMERFAGKWYEQVRDPENMYTVSADCVTMEFSQPKDDGSLDLWFRGFYWMMLSYQGGGGVMYDCDDANDEWACKATMGTKSYDRAKGFPIKYTDYDNYQISYFCNDMIDGVMKYEWFSVYTRDQNASDEVMELAKAKVVELVPSYDIDSILNIFLYWTNQNNCEYEWK